MRSNLSIALALILMANCASRTDSQTGEVPSASQNTQAAPSSIKTETVASPDYVSHESEKKKDVPPEFKGVDFTNFSYPISWRKQFIQLKDGEDEYDRDEALGSGWFSLKGVDYSDLTGDGKEEAVVRVISVACGGSCDGGSYLLYFYTMRANQPRLLWRIETGSLGYGCGLKSLAVGKGAVTIEVFNRCHFDGVSLENKNESNARHKFDSENAFTRFHFGFDGRAFALKKREVFPYSQENVLGFEPEIRTSND